MLTGARRPSTVTLAAITGHARPFFLIRIGDNCPPPPPVCDYELSRQVDGLKLYSPTSAVETTGRRVGGLSLFFPFIFLVIYPFTYLRVFVDMEL